MARNLLRLQKVLVGYCESLEMIVGPVMEKSTTTSGFKEITAEDDLVQKVTFPSLEELTLDELRNMEKLWPDQFQGVPCCQNLTKVTVESCHRLKYLFSYSLVNSLLQLKHLKISRCGSMEGVVDTKGWSERVEGKLNELKVFPKLHSLQLSDLPKLTSFANMGHIHLDSDVEFSSLQILKIDDCSNMLRFISTNSSEDNVGTEMPPQPLFDEKVGLPCLEVLHINSMDNLRKIWHHQLAWERFSKLKNLEIFECNNLMNIFPPLVGSSTPCALVNINVSKCKKIEEIIGHVAVEVKENHIAFSKLKLLKLYYLPRLTSFCMENNTLEFQSLEQVSVIRCPNMKTFSQGVLSTPKLYEVQVTEKEEDELHLWEGSLNSTIQKCYKEMAGIRDRKHLKLSHFSRLREIWHGQALPISFFNNLFKLVVDDCMYMSSAIPVNLVRCLKYLTWLEVRNCDSLEEVLHLEELSNADEEHFGQLFPGLRYLELIDLPKLKRFCNYTENIIELPWLLGLTIENCPDMETFLSNSTSLLHITADNEEPQQITTEENFLPPDHTTPLFDEKIAFPRLSMLKLSRLPKVSYLWKQNADSNKVSAILETLEISECSKLQKLVPSSWHLENLMTLEISKCHGLTNLLTLSTSKSLVNLETMKIADCKMIEEIIQCQVEEEGKDRIVFRKLEYLGLHYLPSLTSFCSGNNTLEFPWLEQALVRKCPKMKIFSQGVVDTPKLNKVKVTEEEDDDEEGCWEGNLNDTIRKLFSEVVSIN